MKSNRYAVAACLVILAGPSIAQTSKNCAPVGVTKGMKYPEARAKIIAQGFIPTGEKPSMGSYCAPDNASHAQTCRKMPEISDCSSNGYCKMDFKGKDGGNLAVTIFGDGPDDVSASIMAITSDCRGKQVKI